ncbi:MULTISPECIES: hypothetical protein [Arthrobacter]|uniref:Uncharacterized protein n=1 Tax=Arthrobacter terricola TaxID=2547396 RepID=A0A4R5KNT3_9MICC|nr:MULTISPECIES: hypothetical protein [Arthrobacter]MBT8160908.1 hypothetical protein [Arthrobacter sp. GN70]TDF97343.1 hypothetical protein E1809_08245 [Arthrobacter terricola]
MTYVAEARPRRETIPAKRRLTPLELRLAESRASRARADSLVRSLLNKRNETIAAALADKVSLSAISTVVGIRAADVKRLGGAYRDHHYPGAEPAVHLARLAAIVRQMDEALEHKESCLRRLRGDALKGLQSGLMDVFRIAALTSLPAERVRELIRPATGPRPGSGPRSTR